MSKWISENMPVIIYPQNSCESRAPPDPPRPHDRAKSPTQQPSRSPAKERASQPNSASDDFSKLPSRRRQVITTFISFRLSGRALDSGQVERQFKSPCLCFFAFFFLFFLLFVSSNHPVCFICLYFSSVLLYVGVQLFCCCTHMVDSWVVVG